MADYAAKLNYQVCPIILAGGIATGMPGGMLLLNTIFSGRTGNTVNSGFDIPNLDDAFGAFNVLPGGTLISQTIGKYPFANQYVAANAVIREPLTISVIMDAPMRGKNAWTIKQTAMTALKFALDKHNITGGTYIVSTPAFIYENLIMTSLTDNSRGNNSLPQNAWRFDFEKPLVALVELGGAQNDFMKKFTNGLPADGKVSGPSPGLQSAQSPQSRTIRTVGGLMAGTPPYLGAPPTQGTMNYPASINPSTFPYTGIS